MQQRKISQPANFLLVGIICSFRLTRRDVLPREWLLRLRAPRVFHKGWLALRGNSTAIVLRRRVISSCLRRIKTAVKYQNIAIARSPPAISVTTGTRDSGKKGGPSPHNAYFALNWPPSFIIRATLGTFYEFPTSFSTFVDQDSRKILVLFHN